MSVFACDLPKLRSGNPCGKFYMMGCKRRLEWSVNELGEGGEGVVHSCERANCDRKREHDFM